MAFDSEQAVRVLRDFEHFMRLNDESRWAENMKNCRLKVSAVEEDYSKALDVFLEDVDSMWGGPMGGGLFEFADAPKWQEKPRAINEFNALWSHLSELRQAALKDKREEIGQ